MYVSMHCNREDMTVKAVWVRRHNNDEPQGSQDYIRLTVETDRGQTTLFLTADQADELIIAIGQACKDRCVVMFDEEAAKAGV